MSATKLYVLFKTNNLSEGNRLLGKQKRTKINCHQNFVLLHVTHNSNEVDYIKIGQEKQWSPGWIQVFLHAVV